jgi:hypothetical protein
MDPQTGADNEEIDGKRLDLATTAFLDEQVEINPEVAQFGFPAPPDDGRYLMKLSYDETQGVKGAVCGKESKTPGKKYAKLPIKLEIIQGPFAPDGKRLLPSAGKFDEKVLYDFPTTLTTDRGTNAIAGILIALGHPVGRLTTRELLEAAIAVLATEPSMFVTGRWEAYIKETKSRVKGQKNFMPVLKDGHVVPGEYQHEYIDKDGNEVRANWNVQKYEAA